MSRSWHFRHVRSSDFFCRLSKHWIQIPSEGQHSSLPCSRDKLKELYAFFFLFSSVTSYQTLPRNMPSHRTQIVPRYPQGYRTLPRNSMMRPESICSVAGSVYDRALHPACTSAVSTTEKRKSMRDDTMWQLYEWQQRQAFSRQSLAQPAGTLLQITSISFLKLYKWYLCLFYISTLCFFFLLFP